MRGLAEGPSPTPEPEWEWDELCLVDNFLPRPPSDDVEPLVDLGLGELKFTKGWTGRSSPARGPVDRIKSAKSRMDSVWIRGSRASGLATEDFLDDEVVGGLLRDDDRAGR